MGGSRGGSPQGGVIRFQYGVCVCERDRESLRNVRANACVCMVWERKRVGRMRPTDRPSPPSLSCWRVSKRQRRRRRRRERERERERDEADRLEAQCKSSVGAAGAVRTAGAVVVGAEVDCSTAERAAVVDELLVFLDGHCGGCVYFVLWTRLSCWLATLTVRRQLKLEQERKGVRTGQKRGLTAGAELVCKSGSDTQDS
ncbi:hypothetical protein B0T26DRAFT_204447 [Lasiosphaeria miniovina]|uniref:Uncharacterized protein n=1 Tax=Lasiosphaeria miniovina TaxID=1954250 RepID=A0AA40E4E9_9PEZI|nr:uncharacterized protein B0T26DRAFT_204447 [Lasiosphaeria miniovina]KAK0722148.1 hypothetical protein B0T26DRAFT_204447 [Lasiosphaeria miniovina]